MLSNVCLCHLIKGSVSVLRELLLGQKTKKDTNS